MHGIALKIAIIKKFNRNILVENNRYTNRQSVTRTIILYNGLNLCKTHQGAKLKTQKNIRRKVRW